MRVVVAPSVSVVASQLQGGEMDVRFYYAMGEKMLRLRLSRLVYDFWLVLQANGCDTEDLQSAAPPEDTRRLVEELAGRGILVPASREQWVADTSLARYDRQLRFLSGVLPVSMHPMEAQRRVLAARVALIGLGGVGASILQHLCMIGVGSLLLVDSDVVDESNLNRQPIYRWDDLGKPKVKRAEDWARAMNPQVNVLTALQNVTETIASGQLDDFHPSLIINCADQPSILGTTRSLVQFSAGRMPILVGGGYYLLNVFAGPLIMPGATACLDCALTASDALDQGQYSVRSGGNFSAAPAVAAAIVANNAFKLLAGWGTCELLSRRVVVSLRDFSVSHVELQRNATCPTCGKITDHTTVRDLK